MTHQRTLWTRSEFISDYRNAAHLNMPMFFRWLLTGWTDHFVQQPLRSASNRSDQMRYCSLRAIASEFDGFSATIA